MPQPENKLVNSSTTEEPNGRRPRSAACRRRTLGIVCGNFGPPPPDREPYILYNRSCTMSTRDSSVHSNCSPRLPRNSTPSGSDTSRPRELALRCCPPRQNSGEKTPPRSHPPREHLPCLPAQPEVAQGPTLLVQCGPTQLLTAAPLQEVATATAALCGLVVGTSHYKPCNQPGSAISRRSR